MGIPTDTIAAIASALGLGATSLIRVSGPGARSVLRSLTSGPDGSAEPEGVAVRWLFDPRDGERLDRAVVTIFESPKSYTGEDVVELSCHGGWLVPTRVLEACVRAGAREAEPGEFTRRAYLNGKLDLVQAEATLDLIEGRSAALHRAALGQLDRGLSARLGSIRENVVRLEALLVHHIDFPEEDDPPVPVERIAADGDEIVGQLQVLLATAPEGELLREGVLTVLAGAPNAGKSSLFNAMLGRERAIVTEVPGTTRDAIESVASIGGYPFRLVDTAGVRESDDQVERLGIEVAERYLDGADLVLFCEDPSAPMNPAVERVLAGLRAPVVRVRTKADRWEVALGGSASSGTGPWVESVDVSVVTGRGLDRLQEVLPALMFASVVRGGIETPVLTRARQAEGVRAAVEEMVAFVEALRGGVPAELASTHLRAAESDLEQVVGAIAQEEVLDRVFREFCVGK